MNRLERPAFFDDELAIAELSKNAKVVSYPLLAACLEDIVAGYRQYVSVNGDPRFVDKVPISEDLKDALITHYNKPPISIAYISELRRQTRVSPCPMCGSFHSGTLDHVLPKEIYGSFAIFGLNLVPSCQCNTLRKESLVGPNPGERVLHPYFDDILQERILSAHFEDLGEVPRVSVKILLPSNDPNYPAVKFHYNQVVFRRGLEQWLRERWPTFFRQPHTIADKLDVNPASRAELESILAEKRDSLDDLHKGKNNWASIFVSGLLEDHVLDWLFPKLTERAVRKGGLAP